MHVHVNAAVSADGKLSTRNREQVRISGDEDFARVDRVRAESDAVMVGVGTVLADDPSLVRFDQTHREALEIPGVPTRVVADSRARTPPDAEVLAGDAPTTVLVGEAAPDDRLDALRDAGASIVVAGEERVDLPAALAELEAERVRRLMVEGGGELVFSLFEDGLVDELTLYVGGLVLGGRDAPTIADGEGFVDRETFPRLALEGVERVDDGVVLNWSVESSRPLGAG
ncbi:2,5-diamino-6-(ribosylamino)-4(3H)-pyrimidinone 5'-phosphate reductase [Halomarina oriensis]|uniref:2,5-diamino-6-(ribosylamino)-4(3H)-pyrimidinone 5'-phosphate reductase n=1 Tax=Halomarina oriensis TaxID=671145 RepID=A0A6B0GP66_9EURY|nr:2,5-diamino-6-(ribosylamino)-4(3H)-pyrimidinone 5'-phosphate reductase [Halomarina oriensis]MWG33935.1 2,5-diamino-6-(ribosylamino)-4(3H)-pyrimidinone 5'-phosphate reductase [Halomarina oriensis]